jgi:hypothetical protein
MRPGPCRAPRRRTLRQDISDERAPDHHSRHCRVTARSIRWKSSRRMKTGCFIWRSRSSCLTASICSSRSARPRNIIAAGLWANTCCSHPYWDEPIDSCARRRLNEELGFNVPLSRRRVVEYSADVGGGLHEHEKVTMYVGSADRATRFKLKPNPLEVDERFAGSRLHDLAMPRSPVHPEKYHALVPDLCRALSGPRLLSGRRPWQQVTGSMVPNSRTLLTPVFSPNKASLVPMSPGPNARSQSNSGDSPTARKAMPSGPFACLRMRSRIPLSAGPFSRLKS